MLSIFTASTGRRALTGSPVNGSSSGPGGGGSGGVVEGADRGATVGRAGAGLVADPQSATANDVPTTVRPRPTAPVNCRRVTCRNRPVVSRGPAIGLSSIGSYPSSRLSESQARNRHEAFHADLSVRQR